MLDVLSKLAERGLLLNSKDNKPRVFFASLDNEKNELQRSIGRCSEDDNDSGICQNTIVTK